MAENQRSLEDCKAASLAAENLVFKSRFDFDVEYGEATYQADPESYTEILAAVAQTELPADFYWVDKDNNKVAFTKQQLQELANVIFLKRLALYKEHQDRKDVMRNATTIEALFF
jgi:hypothetical protein